MRKLESWAPPGTRVNAESRRKSQLDLDLLAEAMKDLLLEYDLFMAFSINIVVAIWYRSYLYLLYGFIIPSIGYPIV